MTSSKFSLLTQHYYRGDGNAATSTAANLVSPDVNLPRCLGMLAAGAEAAGVPYRLGECNSYFDGGAMGVSDSYASALWVLDFLFGCAQGGAAGVNLHGGGDAAGYTPIADNDGAVVAARPEFHGLLLFTLAGQGTLLRTQLSAGQLNATAYAVQTPEGATNVVLVNKDVAQNLDLSVLLPRSATTASLIAMTAPGLTATSGVKIQGAAVGADGSFVPAAAYTLAAGGSQLDCYVPALSAVLIQIA